MNSETQISQYYDPFFHQFHFRTPALAYASINTTSHVTDLLTIIIYKANQLYKGSPSSSASNQVFVSYEEAGDFFLYRDPIPLNT